ncbi:MULTISPECIES: hypothetical protein [unclassified Caballeronia]|uniref:hypothetical protein n=1 Tax=unclassified Caballeronia TaxID=2646786 RepID=UPI002857F6D3|nr:MULTISPECIES: hypothetical protein [unclassified Caballeronia]MDR5763088.1 hypothetical protein [Caballeronia sp. LZ035]MDR5883922.1 hypothetical protein [Caballeronia sp. LZ032]
MRSVSVAARLACFLADEPWNVIAVLLATEDDIAQQQVGPLRGRQEPTGVYRRALNALAEFYCERRRAEIQPDFVFGVRR